MDIISFFAALVLISCIILGSYILVQNPTSTLNILFFLICLTISTWNLCTIFGYHSPSKTDVEIWLKIGACCVIPFFAFGLHFCFFLKNKRKLKIPEMILVYFPMILILIAIIYRYNLFFDYAYVKDRWKFEPAYGSVYFYLLALYSFIYGLFSLILIITYGRKATLKKEKKQALWLILTIASIMLIGLLSRYVLPLFHFYQIPDIGATFFVLYALGIYYSVFYYRFMIFKPSIVVDEIISNISDMVILLDPDLTIISANKKSGAILNSRPEELKGKYFGTIAVINDSLYDELNNLFKGKINNLNYRIYYKNPDRFPADSYISRVTDRHSDLLGFLIISRENKGEKQFRKIYRITDREFIIIDLIISGLTYRQIAEKLKISERTVESHLTNIYDKIGVNNKIELINIAVDFNLIIKN